MKTKKQFDSKGISNRFHVTTADVTTLSNRHHIGKKIRGRWHYAAGDINKFKQHIGHRGHPRMSA